jgi:hypothetical protein
MMERRDHKAIVLWVGCGLLGGCTALNMEPPLEDMQVVDASVGAQDASAQPEDLTMPPPDLSAPPPDLSVSPPDFSVAPPDFSTPAPDFSVSPSDSGVPPPDFSAPVADLALPPIDASTGGPLTLQGGFVGGAITGGQAGQAGYQLRGQFLWHGVISGSGGGYTLSGWLR